MPRLKKPTEPRNKSKLTEAQRLAIQAELDRQRELRDEEQAPAIQRSAVVGADGEIIRAARLKRDGIAFVHAKPLDHLIASSRRKEANGEQPLITAMHITAVEALDRTWRLVGEGVGLGASDWDRVRAPKGTAPMEPAGHRVLLSQIEMRRELEAAATFLGALWPCIRDVCLGGSSPTAWGARMGMHRTVVPGYVRAALDRLVEYYRATTQEPERRQRIRTIAPARSEYDTKQDGDE